MEINDSTQDDYLIMKNISLRNYQIKIIDDAKKQNSIVFLPTGSGKTLIAISVLCSKTREVEGDFPEKAKRIFFVAPTKVLVYQLHKLISIHTKFKVSFYVGDMLVDSWSKKKWLEEFKENQVIVLTGEILRQIIELKVIAVSQISLIVFDECHHAISNHPYSLILQQIAKEPLSQTPLLLGLSAVLLNTNPKKKEVGLIINSLKSLFRGVVLTSLELNESLGFIANPQIELIPYKLSTSLVEKYLPLYDEVIDVISDLILISPEKPKIPFHSKSYKNPNRARRLKNWFVNSKHILEECGLYCGALSILYYIILVEKHRLMTTNPEEIQILIYCRTMFHKLRHILLEEMGEETGENILKYSTNKILTLLNLLYKHNTTRTNKLSTVIFVRQRVTAITVAILLKKLKDILHDFSFLKPEFIIGSNIFDNETLFHVLNNEEIVKEFASENLNTLVSTNLLEEGLDISCCNLVVSFDFPVSYASYLQSKGRARSKEGFYCAFVQEEEIQLKTKLMNEYKQIEEELYQVILESRNQGFENLLWSMEEGDDLSSLPIRAVYRYCSKLPQDKYSYLSPTAWYTNICGQKKASVLLPTNCPLLDVIEGEVMANSKLAKKSAFLETLNKLKEIGEIDENLNPTPFSVKAQCFDYLFPHFKNETICKNSPPPGSKKRKQTYKLKFAKSLSECLPQPGQKAYLHVIDFAFNFEKVKREDKLFVQEVLKKPVTFAILSSKKLCKICQFSLFLDMAQIDCDLLINHREIVLSKSELEDIKSCHFAVFQKVLKITKSFQIFDNSNKGHSFYVVPVKKNESDGFDLDWEIIRCDFCTENKSAIIRYNPFHNRNIKRDNHGLLRETPQMSNAIMSVGVMDKLNFLRGNTYEESDMQPTFVMSEAEYKYFVISPNYRNVHPPQLYIVSKFCYDLSPLSPFPRPIYSDYCDYYEDKYMIKITNVKQPLMKVAFVFQCSNFNKPILHGNFEKVRDTPKTHEELLIPELCDFFPFDRRYWLKALLLPTALNRICQLYSLEEFRRKIVNETGLGEVELPIATEWKPLKVDRHLSENENKKGNVSEILNMTLPLSQLKDRSQFNTNFIDIKRNLLEVSVCDMEYLVSHFGNRISEEQIIESLLLPPGADDALAGMLKNMKGISAPSLTTIRKKENKLGPSLAQLLEALTSSSANDIVNFERLEILGDAFLKFSITLFLFKNLKDNEGVLTFLKGKIVGNRNLLYCGLAKGFQDVLNVTDFSPFSDWNPPLVCLPEKLVDAMKSNNTDPAVTYSWEISPEEQFSGNLSDETFAKNEEIIRNFDKAYSALTCFPSYKSIGDKTISDSVEAVIGLYLREFGIAGGLEILTWLDILPKPSGSYSQLVDSVFIPKLCLNSGEVSVMNILEEVFYWDLEKTLDYEFKNKALLLEAITHPSYTNNRITDCYQRLEFLGDAILDFLITSYIYEYCDDLTPGQVTDIRSSLVNNVTFASLTVRYGFHKYLLKLSTRLNKAIEDFVTHQCSRNHVIDDNARMFPDEQIFVPKAKQKVLILLEEKDCLIAEAVQVPKALGDIFESLAGAIYLDSGSSLETVWTIYYRLMKQEIDTFTKSPPKNPVRLLYEICQETPVFEAVTVDNIVQVACTAWYDNAEIKVYGFGSNKNEAKRSAAKFAMKKIFELKK